MGSRSRTVSVSAWTSADAAAVYALLMDGASWPRWSALGSFELERADERGGEGPGAIRIFRTGFIRSRELIVAAEPDRHFAYTLMDGSRGLGVTDYRADVTLTPERGGTTIVWSGSFRARRAFLGWFWAAFMGNTYRSITKSLVAATARASVGSA
jgi:hypothetical protein